MIYLYILFKYGLNNIKSKMDSYDINNQIEKELKKEMTVHLPSTESGIPKYLNYKLT